MNQSNPLSLDRSETVIGVIGIVASAGGLDAVSQVLGNLPADFPVPILVLQHLARGQSKLVEFLNRKSPLSIHWANHRDMLKPATVYVAPPGYSLNAHPDGTISLVQVDDLVKIGESRNTWPSADQFLSSIAFSYGPRALVVVLTGMGRSGGLGVQEVKLQGGIVLAQDEASSSRWDMPKATIETGCVDLVLPLHEIAPVLQGVVSRGTGLPRSSEEIQVSEALFAKGGAVGVLMHSTDWSRTALGPVLVWEPALRAAVTAMLASPLPQAILWGQELIQIYNDAYSVLLGDAHPQALGQRLSASWEEGSHFLAPLIETVRRTDRAVESADQPFSVHRHGSLEEEYATFFISPIRDEQGDIGGFLLTVMRTTDKHISEHRLRTLLELGSSKVLALSPHKAYDAAILVLAENRVNIPFALLYLFDETYQYASLSGVSGLSFGGPASPRIVDLSSRTVSDWPLDQVVRTKEVVRVDHLAERFRTLPDSRFPETPQTAFLFPLHTSPDTLPVGCAILGANSRSLGDPAYQDFLALVAKQIAQNVRSGQQIEEAQKRAEALAELDRAKTEFFSNISHEFRTPLTLLLGPLEDLLSGVYGEISAPERAALELAHRNSLRLLKQVNTLLDFSRIEAGRMHAHFELVDLTALTTELTNGFRPAIERAGLQLIVNCPLLASPVYVDREMWEKIVLNLLSNALKFTFSGEIEVRLCSLPNHIELTVRDTGVGIPEEHLPHLFKRFHRVPGSRARTREGSGIGLALVDELVHLHRGAIRVQSQPEHGSTFTIWLPHKIRPLQEETSPRSPLSTTTGVTPFLHEATQWVEDEGDTLSGERLPSLEPLSARLPGARILVADDNADMRNYLRHLLSQYWTVEAVSDGEEALTALERTLPDLLLADVMMPKIDGFSLLRIIRGCSQMAALPIILITARAGEETAIEGLLAGADDSITKPFSARELVARVSAQLELTRLRQESQVAIRRSEAFQRAAVEASGVGVWEFNVPTGTYTLSERVYEMLNIPRGCEDLDGAMAERVHPEDRERRIQAMAQALDPTGDGSYHFEHRMLLPNGQIRWLDSRGRATFEGSGEARQPVWLYGTILDITDMAERKRAEAVQVHFRALFESAPGLYLVLEPEEFRIVAVSDAYLRATMTEREGIMGKTLFEVFPDDPAEPFADGVRNLRASLERVRTSARADVMAVQRYPIRRPQSEGGGFEERWWSPINSPVLGPDGKIAFIIHRVEDVTPFIRQMQEQGKEADGLYQLESRAQHMEAEIVLRAQELQRVNEQLRASEERYRALVQATSQVRREG